jgi:hypothetical protein
VYVLQVCRYALFYVCVAHRGVRVMLTVSGSKYLNIHILYAFMPSFDTKDGGVPYSAMFCAKLIVSVGATQVVI